MANKRQIHDYIFIFKQKDLFQGNWLKDGASVTFPIEKPKSSDSGIYQCYVKSSDSWVGKSTQILVTRMYSISYLRRLFSEHAIEAWILKFDNSSAQTRSLSAPVLRHALGVTAQSGDLAIFPGNRLLEHL